MNIITNESDLLSSIREVYSRRPESRFLEAWELQSLLSLLGYTDGVAPEADIVAAMEVARGDYDPEGAAA